MNKELVNTSTGEVAVQKEFMPVEIENMIEKINYVEAFKEKVMKPKLDYGIIPGTTKPTIYKPGAEKLCYAFNLQADYSIESRIEDPFKEWEFVGFDDKKQSTRGYYK